MKMNQVLHIFRKDARHLWREIAASLALLVAFAWLDIRSWSQPYGAMATGVSVLLSAEMLPGLVNLLLPVSWIFLIVRVVQGESLVGDRQFWVTRPYDWKQLLAAKALFVLTFVNFPLLLADAFLLAHAGFHPTHYLAGLLWLQLMWILFLFVWLTALAAVTNSVAQMLLALLLIVLDCDRYFCSLVNHPEVGVLRQRQLVVGTCCNRSRGNRNLRAIFPPKNRLFALDDSGSLRSAHSDLDSEFTGHSTRPVVDRAPISAFSWQPAGRTCSSAHRYARRQVCPHLQR